jgi:hypothetical protein
MNGDAMVNDEVLREPLAVRIALVEQARLTYGVDYARSLWIALGLPTVGRIATKQRKTLLTSHIERFIKECLDPDPLSEVRSEVAFAVYKAWAAGSGGAPVAPQSFGRLLKRAGIASRRSNNTIYCGVRIKSELVENPDPLLDFGPLGQQIPPDGHEGSAGK